MFPKIQAPGRTFIRITCFPHYANSKYPPWTMSGIAELAVDKAAPRYCSNVWDVQRATILNLLDLPHVEKGLWNLGYTQCYARDSAHKITIG